MYISLWIPFLVLFYSRITIADISWFSYAALGLLHTFNPSSSGGVEPIQITSERDQIQRESMTQNSHQGTEIPKGFGRITRDEAGQILHIEMAEGENEGCHPNIMPDMGALAPEMDKAILEKWTTTLGVTKPIAGPKNIVQGMVWLSSLSFHKLCSYDVGGQWPVLISAQTSPRGAASRWVYLLLLTLSKLLLED